ncbi:MAG TPA: RagB/SusD family nutrient uptake outer membrane protein, partial [Cyclobacteriaceae bacterium]|nr:RagB/SusD family nutrient uptake outer membrane protein [Cyclobacteriaceae bacterium]
KVGKLKVEKADGTVVTYDGANGADMVGFYIPENVSNRDPFSNRVYMAPIGNNEISQYVEKGFTLTQTTGW